MQFTHSRPALTNGYPEAGYSMTIRASVMVHFVPDFYETQLCVNLVTPELYCMRDQRLVDSLSIKCELCITFLSYTCMR